MTTNLLQYLAAMPVDELRPIVDRVLGTDAMPVGQLAVTKIGRSVGIQAIGSDIGLLLASPIKWLDLPLDVAETLIDPVFNAYLTGLADAGWSGNEDQVRLTYLTCFASEAFRMSGIVAAVVDRPNFHLVLEKVLMAPTEEIMDRWGERLRFFLSYSREAIQLAKRL